MRKVIITDTTLRDGSHSVFHQHTLDEMKSIAKALEDAGVDIIELGHGDGLTGSSINYGFGLHNDFEYIEAVASVLTKAKLAVLLIPGIGTIEHLEKAKELGAEVIRVATHVTEADVSEQHIKAAKEMGLFTVGFLMMAHMADKETILQEAKKMESYGADVVYMTDSSGAMLPDEVYENIKYLKENLNVPIGHHSHNNLGMAVANSLSAYKAGADYIDGSLIGLGAGAGNCPTEMLVAVLDKQGIENNVDLYKIIDAGDDVLKPIIVNKGRELPRFNSDSLMVGYAGVYSSFMLHAKNASERFKVDTRDILVELGRKKAVGGQEDWIIEVAHNLANKDKIMQPTK
ncbi:4-hydroxy 2-oxovalerate aldolase [Dethiosulfatibacter aminovorans DSM 17477]|uniref:4-hydroxy-2-oxovalerate aldolase n=1 Tax=Dethiosulfatibacter aminovorans DSM 17477 TaxID=1121476 RepID=A0A1M6C2N7_9FIRM|nr:4-hydroxy-2-oxovalerate aldolase [Dethiosulfatibacter aminovorans]SHI55270.1 4-hydroxy 2-oxovalerate aldolase [Dethiosulfatibacter aminovorans DSM 17477]